MNPIKIVSMIVTALLFLGGLFFTGLSFTLGPHWGMLFCCLVLTGFIGFFVWADFLTLKAYFKNDSV